MDKSRTISFFVDLLEVDDEFIEVMLRVGENFCTKKGEYVVRYHRWRFILKVGIINAKLRVEPVDFASY